MGLSCGGLNSLTFIRAPFSIGMHGRVHGLSATPGDGSVVRRTVGGHEVQWVVGGGFALGLGELGLRPGPARLADAEFVRASS